MTIRYQEILFTPAVQRVQQQRGSRESWARHMDRRAIGAGQPDRLDEEVAAFVAGRDSFYMASVTETGWPYLQHRGGPAGFVRALSDRQIGFADYRGNRQYITLGNLEADDRVALFFMDYANRRRLKIAGRAQAVHPGAEPDLIEALLPHGYKATVEQALVITVEAYEWNCSQHIVPRYSAEEIRPGIDKLLARIAALEAELASGRLGALSGQDAAEAP